MKKPEELQILQRVKSQLLDKGEIVVFENGIYKLTISSDDWHEIFKTEAYNMIKQVCPDCDQPFDECVENGCNKS